MIKIITVSALLVLLVACQQPVNAHKQNYKPEVKSLYTNQRCGRTETTAHVL